MSEFGDQLRAAREAAGLSQSQVAEAVGISGNTISYYETGSREPGPGNRDKLVQFFEGLGMTPDDEEKAFSVDEPPKIRKGAARTKPAPLRRPSPGAAVPLAVQLQMPYLLASDLSRTRLPRTSGVLREQAPMCGAAWDQFLRRYPALREKIEQGMIATDIVGLILAHLPIITVAREEIAAQAMEAQRMAGYAGGVEAPAA